MEEQWKDITGYEGLYKVSDLGRVKNAKGLIKSQNISTAGYPQLTLYKENKPTTFKVHQLVAMGFLGYVRTGTSAGLVVDHIDNNKLNKNLTNLQIITNRENSTKDRRGSSKYAGVSWNKSASKWKSRIAYCSKRYFLGYYTDEEEARNAYVQALARIDSGLSPI
jgi:hypothetical protein